MQGRSYSRRYRPIISQAMQPSIEKRWSYKYVKKTTMDNAHPPFVATRALKRNNCATSHHIQARGKNAGALPITRSYDLVTIWQPRAPMRSQ